MAKSRVGLRFRTEKELREFMGSPIPKGQEYCVLCQRLKKKGKPCPYCSGVFGV